MSSGRYLLTQRPRDDRRAHPDAARLARVLVHVWLEVQCGMRPWSHIAALTAPALQRRLAAQLSPVAQPNRQQFRIIRVHSSPPTINAVESSVIVEIGQRVHAFAVRVERHHGAWRGVELTAPDAGLQALRTASAPERHSPDVFDEVLGADLAATSDASG